MLCAVAVTACTSEQPVTGAGDEPTGSQSPSATSSAGQSPDASASPSASPDAQPSPTETEAEAEPRGPARFRAAAAMADVRRLAGQIGPRLATGPAFREAARLVARRFTGLGYDVRRQWFPVPAGDSWGVPVEAGRSFNVIATPPGFDETEPHRIVGAHLDTVAVAPGAEDNASGVAVMLELARLAAAEQTRLPTVFIAFGAEEPRGPGDDMHHFGSQHYVAQMPGPQRRALRAMLAVDRVGVGTRVPVCTGPLSPPDVQDRILALSRSVDIRSRSCELTTSDHWSFEKAGFTVARLGSTPYAGYHSEADRPRVINPRQLGRTGRLAWAWLQPR